jgi:hypothetical protein
MLMFSPRKNFSSPNRQQEPLVCPFPFFALSFSPSVRQEEACNVREGPIPAKQPRSRVSFDVLGIFLDFCGKELRESDCLVRKNVEEGGEPRVKLVECLK